MEISGIDNLGEGKARLRHTVSRLPIRLLFPLAVNIKNAVIRRQSNHGKRLAQRRKNGLGPFPMSSFERTFVDSDRPRGGWMGLLATKYLANKEFANLFVYRVSGGTACVNS